MEENLEIRNSLKNREKSTKEANVKLKGNNIYKYFEFIITALFNP